ncbi:MAG: ribosome biogenesis protein [Candidatus Brockarchaeota archaeon]|nr:ribosome biogenesis protein [Candidatus Brockarchaeota archaeon]MBO3808698.1 ribosome biogenesis protein [Candidatus Brockarchaeota archaeon]
MAAKKLRKCPRCKKYMLEEVCKKCGVHTLSPHPPKFSLEDPFLEYKVRALLEALKASG